MCNGILFNEYKALLEYTNGKSELKTVFGTINTIDDLRELLPDNVKRVKLYDRYFTFLFEAEFLSKKKEKTTIPKFNFDIELNIENIRTALTNLKNYKQADVYNNYRVELMDLLNDFCDLLSK